MEPETLNDHFFSDDDAGVGRMVDYVFNESAYTRAINVVEEIGSRSRAEVSLDTMVSSNSDHVGDELPTAEDLRAAIASDRVEYFKTLHWLCHAINCIFCDRGYNVVFLPVDSGHPLGNHVAVSHVWSSHEAVMFQSDGILPIAVYDADAADRKTSVFRLIDMSVGAKGKYAYPLHMRQANWTYPASSQPFLFIGSPMKASIMEWSTLAADYMFLPSESTKIHSFGVRTSQATPSSDQGERFWRKDVTLAKDALPRPKFNTNVTQVFPLTQGCGFMSDAEVNPLRYIMSLGHICRLINELMSGQDDERMQLQNPQSNQDGLSIRKGDYRLPMKAVHEAAWTHSRKSTN